MLSSVLNDSAKVSYYLGTNNLDLFWSSLFYGYVGVLIMILLDVAGRDPQTVYSPIKFNWKYFWEDNVPRFILNMILVFVCIRFLPEIFNKPLSQFYALLIGIGSDMLAAKIKAKKNELFDEENNPLAQIAEPLRSNVFNSLIAETTTTTTTII